ncbi:MAG: peptidoglycan-associated lipoprotein Pal [Alphaproteobacteria bacterium]|nr:MAG: peptidoglycan-associated lipoprotein Pal [Alphaproteobacteria bacterium]
MKRLKHLAWVAILAIALAGCTKKNEEVDTGLGTDERPPVTGFEDGASMDGVDQSGIMPGTQQDLVVNVGDRVFFDYDQYTLRSDARETIERQATWLKQHGHLTFVIEGHCDERGTREYNLALGERRAQAVRNYLVALGIEPSRIQVISYGKERPAALGANPNAWAQNRRGVVVIK